MKKILLLAVILLLFGGTQAQAGSPTYFVRLPVLREGSGRVVAHFQTVVNQDIPAECVLPSFVSLSGQKVEILSCGGKELAVGYTDQNGALDLSFPITQDIILRYAGDFRIQSAGGSLSSTNRTLNATIYAGSRRCELATFIGLNWSMGACPFKSPCLSGANINRCLGSR